MRSVSAEVARASLLIYTMYMKYTIILQKSVYGYAAHVPALPGCHSQGKTKKEALGNVRDAILTYIGMEKVELRAANVKEVEVALSI